ncbi:MAG: TonB-dependent receptor [Bacteroidales bacterium]|nr:TonB-dependent receptor [Bacteroidales bacterium]
MKRTGLLRAFLVIAALLMSAAYVEAQPGGPGGFPGGRPPAGRPGGRPPRPGQDWSQMGNDQNANQVKQKKKVKEGDTFKVVGSLRDSVSGEFLAFVNVAVLDSVDSTFVKGGSTNFDGLFELADIPMGAYLLRISAIGYQNRLIPFNVTNNTALGTIRLQPGATTLKEVKITAEKPLYAMDGEKLIYNVSEDPSIQTGTTEDALQNAPGVEVDVEGNITLRGVSSVEIWINDKPSKLTEENLKTYLQTLPANALARIETITNPSAKYATDAEAVINIITSAHIKSNQFISFGVNGSNQPFISPWVSYMWAKEKLSINLFASGRYSSRENTNTGWSMRRRVNAAGNGFDTTLYQTDSAYSESGSGSGNFFLGVNYEIDSMSELSFDAGGFYNSGSTYAFDTTMQHFYVPLVSGLGDSILNYTTDAASQSHSLFTHAGADYTKKFDNEGHNLRLGVNTRLSHNASDEWNNRMYDTYFFNGEHDQNRYLLSRTYSYGASIDARYNRPYSKDGEMSYGLRADVSSMDNDYRRYNDSIGTLVDTLRTYHFDGSDANIDADVDWTHRWGGFTLSSGLGVGLNREDYHYISDMPFADGGVNYFVDFHPSIHLTYRTEDMHNFKLNYTMRMSNPDESQTSTFRRYGDDSYSTGNPNLKNSYTHNVEAGWQKYFMSFGNIGIEGYGRLSTNEVSSLTDSKEDEFLERIITYSIPYNMGSSWRYGASLNMTYRPTGFFNVRLYANVYDYGYRMEYMRNGVQQLVEDNKVSWSVRLNAWAKIFNQYQVHLSANYNSPTLGLMSTRGARYSLNMGVRSDFFKRKLSVFVNVQDIFNWGGRYGSTSQNTNPYYLNSNTGKMLNSRYISAGITLRFGKLELEQGAKEGDSETGDTL